MNFVTCSYCGEQADHLVDDLMSQPVGTDDWNPHVFYRLERCQCGGLQVATIAHQTLPERNTESDIAPWTELLEATEVFLATYAGRHPSGTVGRIKAAVDAIRGGKPS